MVNRDNVSIYLAVEECGIISHSKYVPARFSEYLLSLAGRHKSSVLDFDKLEAFRSCVSTGF